jgi:5-hydroxyisourate hydrolase
VRHPAFEGRLVPGPYEALFHVADYYRAAGAPLPDPPFLDVVVYRFGIGDAGQHYHLPLKVTPWGFSLFRGQ